MAEGEAGVLTYLVDRSIVESSLDRGVCKPLPLGLEASDIMPVSASSHPSRRSRPGCRRALFRPLFAVQGRPRSTCLVAAAATQWFLLRATGHAPANGPAHLRPVWASSRSVTTLRLEQPCEQQDSGAASSIRRTEMTPPRSASDKKVCARACGLAPSFKFQCRSCIMRAKRVRKRMCANSSKQAVMSTHSKVCTCV